MDSISQMENATANADIIKQIREKMSLINLPEKVVETNLKKLQPLAEIKNEILTHQCLDDRCNPYVLVTVHGNYRIVYLNIFTSRTIVYTEKHYPKIIERSMRRYATNRELKHLLTTWVQQ